MPNMTADTILDLEVSVTALEWAAAMAALAVAKAVLGDDVPRGEADASIEDLVRLERKLTKAAIKSIAKQEMRKHAN